MFYVALKYATVICSLAALNKSSKMKKTEMEKQIFEALQQARDTREKGGK